MTPGTRHDDPPTADARGALAAVLGREPDDVTEHVLDRARRWVEHESPSGDTERTAALAEEIAGCLGGNGATAETLDAPGWGRHVRATRPGRDGDAAPLVVLGHLDTVHPVGTIEERPFRVEDGRAYGPGIYDMKAPLAVLAEAIALGTASDGPRRPVDILITCDEEVGSPTSRGLIETMADGAAAVLVLEPPLSGGHVKTARKGVAVYELSVTGRAAHAGLDPERGISAVEELAHQIIRIAQLADASRGTTVNIGVIEGGTASNVVAEHARAEIEVRLAHAAEGARVDDALHALAPVTPGARLHLDGGEDRPPLERTAEIERLFYHARDLAAALGFEIGEGSAGGASDGSLTAALGVPTLDGLGVDGDGAHAVHEHILVDDLARRVALIERLLATL